MTLTADATLIFGATRGTGLEVAKLLTARGEKVVAFARPTAELTALRALPLEQIVYGDICDPVSVAKAFATGWFRSVVCTIGGSRGQAPRPDVIGVRHIVDSIKKLGRAVPRLALVTAIGAGDSRGAVAPKVIEVLGEVLRLKTEAEDCLRSSGVEWVILRPGGMTHDPASGTAIRTEDHSVMGVINRADLARLVVECLDDPATNGRVFHTIDPAIQRQAPLQRGDPLDAKT